MKAYLIDTFQFNDRANRQILQKIAQLPEPASCIRYFSHLINSQNKWMARIRQDPGAQQMSWWDPVYTFDQLAPEWERSLDLWLDYLVNLPEVQLTEEVQFAGFDGGRWAATPQDIALQLNYHSIHHRAQMQLIIREQGLVPDFIDYIGTVYRRVSD